MKEIVYREAKLDEYQKLEKYWLEPLWTILL